MPTRTLTAEPPLDVFSLTCPACNGPLRVLKSHALKTRRESRVQLRCDICRARYRLRLERLPTRKPI